MKPHGLAAMVSCVKNLPIAYRLGQELSGGLASAGRSDDYVGLSLLSDDLSLFRTSFPKKRKKQVPML
jgi:hypothetical protein